MRVRVRARARVEVRVRVRVRVRISGYHARVRPADGAAKGHAAGRGATGLRRRVRVSTRRRMVSGVPRLGLGLADPNPTLALIVGLGRGALRASCPGRELPGAVRIVRRRLRVARGARYGGPRAYSTEAPGAHGTEGPGRTCQLARYCRSSELKLTLRARGFRGGRHVARSTRTWLGLGLGLG